MSEDDIRDYLVNSGKFIDPAKWIILMFKEIYGRGFEAGEHDVIDDQSFSGESWE